MNEQYEVIFHQALQSPNPQAIFHVAGAFRDMGEVDKANILQQRLSVGFGIEVPPVPMPEGYRRATAKEITKPVLAFAQQALKHALPIGKRQIANITMKDKSKKTFLALTEHHLDNHPARPKQGYKAGEGPEFLHPGISILTLAGDFSFGVDVKPGGMSANEENAFRKALWAESSIAIEGGILAAAALAFLLFRKRLGFVH